MKTAIVTGAAGGIGYATVKKLISEGFSVAAADILPADAVTEKFKGFGDKCRYFTADIGKSDSRKSFVNAVYEAFGEITVLVNVAGVAPKERNDILSMTEESYDFVTNINTKGTFFLTQDIANRMIKTEGKKYIINISSMSGYTVSVNRGEYCISKAGVSMITKLFAERLAEFGILVNEIRPGIIATGMTDKVKQKYDDLIDGGLLPIARWGKPEDIANGVFSLCSGLFDYTTGQSIDIDGGFHIRSL
ncbi:MAG: 3-ketoacyl-ACP reductase [Clostridia bacterium]|nr:3-ketoacyl-ACP reductase [Clostridia bacterium]